MSDEAAWQEFRRRRDEGLAAPHGILAQVGLQWVDPSAGPQAFDDVPGAWEVVDGHLVGTWEDDALRLLATAPEIDLHQEAGRARVTVLAESRSRWC